MNRLSFTPTRCVTKQSFIFADLHSSCYIFLKNDVVKKPLFSYYSGSYKVLVRHEKYLTIQKIKRHAKSIDPLKPAYIEKNHKHLTQMKANQQTCLHPKISIP